MPDPSPRVLDLFAVPDDPQPLPGGQGASVRAGDLVLSPGRDQETQAWLSPVLARLAVRLDEDPHRTARDLRIAMPVPARDGTWVVDGWAASRYEPGTESCHDLEVVRRTGHLLHARLALVVPHRPPALDGRADRWAVAERVAFGDRPLDRADAAADLARSLLAGLEPSTAPAQLVHADLAGNVLLDLAGAPMVIDVSPAWRPVGWVDAVCVLDSVLWRGADPAALDDLAADDVLRAVVFRVLSDDAVDVAAYALVAERVLGQDT